MLDLPINIIAIAVGLSLMAGLSITLGAFFARKKLFHKVLIEQEFGHFITAFGGGALISAIAFVLIPESIEKQPSFSVLITFAAGGVCFMAIDMVLARSKSNLSQFFAMMLDFIPEAIVLGVVIAETTNSMAQAIFIACVISAQNFPEGYSAYKEMSAGDKASNNKLMRNFMIVGLSGPLFLLLGTEVFVDWPMALGMIMTFCAGGILYLVFEDIAPRVAMKKHWLPPLGAVGGFMVGLAGFLFVGN
jgi:ZIP family zinc transporter